MPTVVMPKYIDDPPNLLLWRLDDVIPFLLILIVALLVEKIWLLIPGFFVIRLYSRFRDTRPDGYALHVLYWYGLFPMLGRTTPNPFIRQYLP
jgi:conjugal transfer pilus assembly protein TraL